MFAGAKGVTEFAQINELHHLRFTDDQLRAALDLFVVIGKPKGERVPRIVRPLNDVDDLGFEKVQDANNFYSLGCFKLLLL